MVMKLNLNNYAKCMYQKADYVKPIKIITVMTSSFCFITCALITSAHGVKLNPLYPCKEIEGRVT